MTWSVGEALLASQGSVVDADAIVTAWLESPSHRAIILSPTWRDTGIGAAVRIERTRRVRRRGRRSSSPPTSAFARDERAPRELLAGSYAASVWIGVASGSISDANPRSQVTTTRPCSSIWSTMPRSPARQTRVVARSLDELDPRSDRDTGPEASREKSCALRVHTQGYRFRGPKALPSASRDPC